MTSWVACALLCLTAAAQGPSGERTLARYAIVIGHNGGNQQNADLRYADDDAARLYLQVLPSVKRAWLLTTFDQGSAGSYPDLTQVARSPTLTELAHVLGELNWTIREQAREGEDTELLFYYAGHGDVDATGEGFLLLHDGALTRRGLQRQVVEGSLADVNHIILDACASYYMAPRRGGKRAERVQLDEGMLDALDGHRLKPEAAAKTGILVSTSDASDVHESADLGGGVFSFLLRSALAGGADISGDGKVEYAEAAAFISAASSGLEDPAARVRVHARAPAQRPHAALVDLGASDARHFLVIDGQGDRRVRVLDNRGVPYAEVRSAAERVTLALTGSPYFVVQVGAREAVLVPRRAGAYALSSLDFEEAVNPRSLQDSRLAGLFGQAFTSAYLQGFLANSSLLPPVSGPRLDVAYVAGHEEPFQVPWTWLGTASVGVAGVAAALALVAAGGNVVSFLVLQESFDRTRYLDPGQALAVELWRGAAITLTAGAVLAAVAGGGFFAVDFLVDEEEAL